MGKTRRAREESDDEGPETVTLATVRSQPLGRCVDDESLSPCVLNTSLS
jgi:hypothetical protein